MTGALLLFFLGFAVGVAVYYWLADCYAASETGRRRAALRDAENRIRDAQIRALNGMADAAADVVFEQTAFGPTQWPSESFVDGSLTRNEP